MIKTNKTTAGFTLLEFLAVMVLVAVLAVIAVPVYDSYVKKARFQNLIVTADSLKNVVAACAQKMGSIGTNITNTNCPDVAASTSYGATSDIQYTITISSAGLISAAPSAEFNGIATTDTYTLTPTLLNSVISWVPGGTCSASKLC